VVHQYKQRVMEQALHKLKAMEAQRRARESDKLWWQRRQLQRLIDRAFRSIVVPPGGLAALERYKRLTLLAALRYLEKLSGRHYLARREGEELNQLRRKASEAWKRQEMKQRHRVARYHQAIVKAHHRLHDLRQNNTNANNEEFAKRQSAQQQQQDAWSLYIGHLRTLRDAPLLNPNATSSSSTTSSTAAVQGKMLIHVQGAVKNAFQTLAVAEPDVATMNKYEERLTQHATKTATALTTL